MWRGYRPASHIWNVPFPSLRIAKHGAYFRKYLTGKLCRMSLLRGSMHEPCMRKQVAHGEGSTSFTVCECLVADHGHLAHVCVVGQLCKDKSRNICP
jgi:hypothetical protein